MEKKELIIMVSGQTASGKSRLTYLLKKLNKIIDTTIKEFLNENKAYDDLLSLKKWFDEENKKLEKIKDYKTKKFKSKLLQKQFFHLKNEIIKKENPFGIEGDMSSNYIYHYTDGESLFGIITESMLMGGGDEYGGISFTTHPNLYKRGFVFWHPNEYSKGKHHGNIGVRIKFDFNQMKKDGLRFRKGSENMGTHSGEEEIRLLKDELENPIKYIKEIIIFKNKEEKYLELSNLLKKTNIKHKVI